LQIRAFCRAFMPKEAHPVGYRRIYSKTRSLGIRVGRLIVTIADLTFASKTNERIHEKAD
jgi:hypothetical protein